MRGGRLHRVFTPVSIPCYDFTLEDGTTKNRVTVIIAPIKLVEFKDGSLGVSFACSRGAFCHDPYCRYSKVGKNRGWEEQG